MEIDDGPYWRKHRVASGTAQGCPRRGLKRSSFLIAHNPGIGDLAVGLAGTGDAQALERMQAKYPTGGLATLTFDGSWADLGWASTPPQLAGFVVPRDLSG